MEKDSKQKKDGGKQPTISDIAKLAGVSAATVSYVINDKKGVSDEVRARVRAVMARVGYSQNLRAKGLKTRHSYTIHAVIRKEAAPACKTFYFGVIACMAERLSPGSYSIVPVFQSDDESDTTLPDLIRNGDTDGIIAFQGLAPRTARALERGNFPCVVVNPGFEAEPGAVSVQIDFEELSYRAAAYLVSLGHKDVAFVGMRSLPFFFNATKRGFRRAMRENALPVRKEWIRGEATCSEGAAKAMRNILAAGGVSGCGHPTAVFCAQDNFAISAMSAARAAGYRVPEDISFIGLDDVPEAKYIEPPLATIPISPQILADEAIDRLFAMMAGAPAESVTIPSMEVAPRASVTRRE
ncbi:MAG: LacI family transcriptional regulator [Clostridiales Family XIII bacterium]|jgi:LacI family transcriptional regulator/LacI family purine nucleotide synthesis repressor|nr:LacI family transcriptional regulator [Clostridiales Family XIII bacterium]